MIWAIVGIVLVIVLAAGYVAACNAAIASLDWEDEE